MRRFYPCFLLLFCIACAQPQEQPRGAEERTPALQKNDLLTSDGNKLPVRSWLPSGKPKAVVVALHGMNDYSHAFDMPARELSARGIAVYAYDQRGFGASPNRGIWAGADNLVADVGDMVKAVRYLYPHTQLYVMGESMGGAVIIAAFAEEKMPPVDGVILSAPAVWGGAAMNPVYRAFLWGIAHVVPEKRFTGQGLHIHASDNIAMLRELAVDPLVLKGTRVDSILGMVRLMDKGHANLHALQVPTLVLYGQKDEVIPPSAVAGVVSNAGVETIFSSYPQGYHLLLRDLHRDVPTSDIIAWIQDHAAALPSGGEEVANRWLKTQEESWIDVPAHYRSNRWKHIEN